MRIKDGLYEFGISDSKCGKFLNRIGLSRHIVLVKGMFNVIFCIIF